MKFIEKPGIYFDFPEADYFADPCPEPSLTQSVSKVLLEQSPAHARLVHPRLAKPEDEEDKYTAVTAIGNAAHKLMLGRGRELAILDYADFRTNVAKEARAQAEKHGQLPVLAKHYDTAEAMVKAAREQLNDTEYHFAFSELGNSEVVLGWEERGVWCRSLVDWTDDYTVVADYKTSGMSCSPYVVAERPSEMGWDLQAAFIERGLDILDPNNAGRREFVFITQENHPPYALVPVRISEADLTLGRKKAQMAIELWGNCMRWQRWPAYSLQTVHSRPKPWLETRVLEREIDHEERKQVEKLNPEILAAG